MIGYKDMTFCFSNCGNTECPRKLTQNIYDEAEAWWGTENPPITLADFATNCDSHIEGDDNEQKS